MLHDKNENEQYRELTRQETTRLRWLLIMALGLFLAGIVTPMLTITKFILIENSFSVLSGILELLQNGRVFLFLLVAGFSLVLPVMKMFVIYRILSESSENGPTIRRYLHLMHVYGRWSMLDVMVVALLIVTVKLGAIASIEVHFGLYIFAASVLLLMFITGRVVKLTR